MGLERNYGLQAVHVAAIVFAALHLAFTGLTAVVGLFANGATPWERILMSGVHPLAAASLLAVLATPLATYTWSVWAAVFLLLVSVFGDAAVYIAISRGVIKGDTALVIAFAVVPALGVAYLLAREVGRGQVVGSGLAG